jgi:hypothetical protein
MITTTTEELDDMAKKKAAGENKVRFPLMLDAEQRAALERIQAESPDRPTIAHLIRSGIYREIEARGYKVKGAKHGR